MAKKLLVYSLITFYIAFQVRPLTVVIRDVLAHTFFKAQHMATIHFENGKYHVHADLKAIADDENGITKDNTTSSKKIYESDVHVTQEFDFCFDALLSDQKLPVQSKTDVLSAYIQLEVPPPKA